MHKVKENTELLVDAEKLLWAPAWNKGPSYGDENLKELMLARRSQTSTQIKMSELRGVGTKAAC